MRTAHAAAVLFTLSTGIFSAAGDVAHAADLQRGRALYENHCIVCHGRQVHGRPGRPAPTAVELRQIVDRWQQAEGLHWSGEEIDDVTAYLLRVVYGGVLTGSR